MKLQTKTPIDCNFSTFITLLVRTAALSLVVALFFAASISLEELRAVSASVNPMGLTEQQHHEALAASASRMIPAFDHVVVYGVTSTGMFVLAAMCHVGHAVYRAKSRVYTLISETLS